MNGRDLPKDHGHPVRAIVPGHYGMASVKWLTHIEAVRTSFLGYWQTMDYAYWARADGQRVRRALAEAGPKSEIIPPRALETIAPNEHYTLEGIAWAGEAEVTRVRVSTDGGQRWSEATCLDPSRRYAWRRWTFDWLMTSPPRKPARFSQRVSASWSCSTLRRKDGRRAQLSVRRTVVRPPRRQGASVCRRVSPSGAISKESRPVYRRKR